MTDPNTKIGYHLDTDVNVGDQRQENGIRETGLAVHETAITQLLKLPGESIDASHLPPCGETRERGWGSERNRVDHFAA